MRADIQRDYRMVVFLEVVVQWLDAASTARQHARVQSRHPGRNPKLESSTLSYPAFEPLTERHAFRRACSTELSLGRYPRCRPGVISVLVARQVNQSLELRTNLIVHLQVV